jgi:hypothetical protein
LDRQRVKDGGISFDLLTFRTATCNPYFYGQKALNYLTPKIGKKLKGFLTKWVLLPHDNTHLRSVAPTVEVIKQLKFQIFPHLPHRPDLAPSNYHMFGPTKETLHG